MPFRCGALKHVRAERLIRGGSAVYLRLGGVVTKDKSQDFDPSVLAEHEMNGNVVISLRDVILLNSSGIGMLLRLNRTLRDNGGKLVLTDVPLNVHQVFQFMRLDSVLLIADDEQAAEEMLR